VPPTALQPLIEWLERILAHSDRLVLPRITMPASVSRLTSGASRLVTLSFSAREPAVVAVSSALSILSFSRIGTPCSGPRSLPALRSASRARASARAWGFRAMTACSVSVQVVNGGQAAEFTLSSAVDLPVVWACCSAAAEPGRRWPCRCAGRDFRKSPTYGCLPDGRGLGGEGRRWRESYDEGGEHRRSIGFRTRLPPNVTAAGRSVSPAKAFQVTPRAAQDESGSRPSPGKRALEDSPG
jgi:hypothetical protein